MIAETDSSTPANTIKKKKAEWFKHDTDASRDEKLLQLRAVGGWEYVGLWWALIELLSGQDDFALREKSFPGTAVFLSIPQDKFKDFIGACLEAELLVKEEDRVFSNSLRERLSKFEVISRKRAQAGAKGAAAKDKEKAKEKEKEANAEQLPGNCPIYSLSSSDLNSFDSSGGAGGANCTGAVVPAELDTPEVNQAITRWRAHLLKNHNRVFDAIAEESLYSTYLTRRDALINNIEWSVQSGWKTIREAPVDSKKADPPKSMQRKNLENLQKVLKGENPWENDPIFGDALCQVK